MSHLWHIGLLLLNWCFSKGRFCHLGWSHLFLTPEPRSLLKYEVQLKRINKTFYSNNSPKLLEAFPCFTRLGISELVMGWIRLNQLPNPSPSKLDDAGASSAESWSLKGRGPSRSRTSMHRLPAAPGEKNLANVQTKWDEAGPMMIYLRGPSAAVCHALDIMIQSTGIL